MVHSLCRLERQKEHTSTWDHRRLWSLKLHRVIDSEYPRSLQSHALYVCTYKPYKRKDSDMDDKRAGKQSYSAISAMLPGNAGMRVS